MPDDVDDIDPELLPHRISVETYRGAGPHGPVHAPAVTLPAVIWWGSRRDGGSGSRQDTRNTSSAGEVIAQYAHAATLAVESKVTDLATGRVGTVTACEPLSYPGAPAHVEVVLA